jgi:hypothetical protein
VSLLDLLSLCFIVISLQPPLSRATKQPHPVARPSHGRPCGRDFGGAVGPDCYAAHLITARLREQPTLGAAGHRRPARACRLTSHRPGRSIPLSTR